jgi:hypothetical protein
MMLRTALAATMLSVIGCGGSTSAANAKRPPTSARLQIVAPTPNEVTGPDTVLQLNLIGATVAPQNVVGGTLRGDEGHIHVSADGKLVSMAFGLSQPLTGLAPGPHSVQAEFVATDHRPFANRVVAAVLFEVK